MYVFDDEFLSKNCIKCSHPFIEKVGSGLGSEARLVSGTFIPYPARPNPGSTKCKTVHKNTTNLGFFSFWCISKRKMLFYPSYKKLHFLDI
jgi:hypothetical protein